MQKIKTHKKSNKRVALRKGVLKKYTYTLLYIVYSSSIIASRDIHFNCRLQAVFLKAKSEIFTILSLPTYTLRAAKSLCTRFFDAKYSYKID